MAMCVATGRSPRVRCHPTATLGPGAAVATGRPRGDRRAARPRNSNPRDDLARSALSSRTCDSPRHRAPSGSRPATTPARPVRGRSPRAGAAVGGDGPQAGRRHRTRTTPGPRTTPGRSPTGGATPTRRRLTRQREPELHRAGTARRRRRRRQGRPPRRGLGRHRRTAATRQRRESRHRSPGRRTTSPPRSTRTATPRRAPSAAERLPRPRPPARRRPAPSPDLPNRRGRYYRAASFSTGPTRHGHRCSTVSARCPLVDAAVSGTTIAAGYVRVPGANHG